MIASQNRSMSKSFILVGIFFIYYQFWGTPTYGLPHEHPVNEKRSHTTQHLYGKKRYIQVERKNVIFD